MSRKGERENDTSSFVSGCVTIFVPEKLGNLQGQRVRPCKLTLKTVCRRGEESGASQLLPHQGAIQENDPPVTESSRCESGYTPMRRIGENYTTADFRKAIAKMAVPIDIDFHMFAHLFECGRGLSPPFSRLRHFERMALSRKKNLRHGQAVTELCWAGA